MQRGSKEYLQAESSGKRLRQRSNSGLGSEASSPRGPAPPRRDSSGGRRRGEPQRPEAREGPSRSTSTGRRPEAGRRGAGEEAEEEDDGARSVHSEFSIRTAVVEQHSRGQPDSAAGLKVALKEFVNGLVKGRELRLQPASGPLQPSLCRLTPEVDALLVGRLSPERVPLAEVLHVHRGLEAVPLDLGFPLDSSIVVLELASGRCLSLNMGHARAAEDFALYLRLLTAMRRQETRSRPQRPPGPAKPPDNDDDDARSECSVRTATVEQQLSSAPLSTAACQDPKEVKQMFKMFKETMRRGRDFYVVEGGGELYDVECSLSQGHDEFRMRWDFQNRTIPLREMVQIRTHQEAAGLGLGFAPDARCATLELQTGECITFKFGHVEACERFVICMRLLVEQKRPRFVSRSFSAASLAGPSSSAGLGGADPLFGPPQAREAPQSARSASSAASTRSSRAGSSASGRKAASGSGSGGSRAVVEAFVRQMVLGCQLSVVGPGGLQTVRCSMGAALTALQVTAGDGSSREVPMAQIKTVHVGAEATKLGLDGIAVDELCATVELMSGDCLTFRFPRAEERDRFAVCIRIFASAHQQQ